MARIRKIEITHFRGIKHLEWCPSPGINCLIGPGDSGKSTILDAIDLCLGARRQVQFTDADFSSLNVDSPLTVTATIGELDDALKTLESYGMFLRSFDPTSGVVEDEPEKDRETVLTVRLTVASDLEPVWSLVSVRAEAEGVARSLTWADRVRLAPTRIGAMADYHLGWRRGSVLNRVSEERVDASATLIKAARDARIAFGAQAQDQLGETLTIVAATAKELGIPVGEKLKAMLDADSVSFSGGTISLHDEEGIPLRGLGVGSTRLLIAGLQRKAAATSTIAVIDEVEHGLEPHRIIRLLGSLGAKDSVPPLQVFMTTHSPIVLQELSGDQLFVARPSTDHHDTLPVGLANSVQGTIRRFPDAFLASNVVICEGASEVGLVRGVDQHRVRAGTESINAQGTALVDCGGGSPDSLVERAVAFADLGYRVAVIRDDDRKPTAGVEAAFIAAGGNVFAWRDGRTLEDELFLSLSDDAVEQLIAHAVAIHGEPLVDGHVRSRSQNTRDLAGIRAERLRGAFSADTRAILGKAACIKNNGWFKSVSWMEDVARDIVAPDLPNANAQFRSIVDNVFAWASDGG
jgi:putative ATP-dependent endonuclease of the OLD family